MVYPIITLEGLSGTGKTTAGKLLAEKTNGLYFHCKEGNPIEFARQFFNKMPLPISYFYYILYFSLSLRRGKKLAKSSIIYMDKSGAWIYSHYKARNLPDIYFKFLPKYLSKGLDAILYFTLNEQERSKRIKKRVEEGKATTNDIKSLEISEKTDYYYRKYSPSKTIEINADNKTPEKVTSLTLSKLKSQKII